MTEEERKKVNELMMSPTFGTVLGFASKLEIDPKNAETVKSLLSASTLMLVKAMDKNKIHFDDEKDEAMFYGQLSVCMAFVMGTTEFEFSSIQ
ncbi:hypothetical protein [Agarilytica rhodophyticola]|uniref:hypothetical protein n=1 Tax=Agarilytica rhodophyticola TaxID=1737490 RepID=UPI000B344C2B|nr:hypothetical protein [Agarilytica rhodophyticola]